MIRINRGPEPPELAHSRGTKLAQALAQWKTCGTPPASIKGYECAKEPLFLAQMKKCAYCERTTDLSSAPTEHFRPKNGAWRHDPGTPQKLDGDHYWWLAWTWENLLFSCVRCNDQAHKANYFPLNSKACKRPRKNARLETIAHLDISQEEPMLIDPATEDPLDHLQWKPVQPSLPRKQWSWDISWHSPKGRKTVEILKLRELAEDVAAHLSTSVLPPIETIEQRLQAGHTNKARILWEELLGRVLAPKATLSFAVWCALRLWMPPAIRKKHGLAPLPRPGA